MKGFLITDTCILNLDEIACAYPKNLETEVIEDNEVIFKTYVVLLKGGRQICITGRDFEIVKEKLKYMQ